MNNESKYLSFAPLSQKKSLGIENTLQPNVSNQPPYPEQIQEKYFTYKPDQNEHDLILKEVDNNPVNYVRDQKVENICKKGRVGKRVITNLQKNQKKSENNVKGKP